MPNALWFFGAGASKPFGIPTMQEMVTKFQKIIRENGSWEEHELYDDILNFLSDVFPDRKVDLEAIYTVISSISDWNPERIGLAALYHALHGLKALRGEKDLVPSFLAPLLKPDDEKIKTAKEIESELEQFVKNCCSFNRDVHNKIIKEYDLLFERVGPRITSNWTHQNARPYGPIFTTNYDVILEYYFNEYRKSAIVNGFYYDEVARMRIWRPENTQVEQSYVSQCRLMKLHGSISWLTDLEYGITEHIALPHNSEKISGTRFPGHVMLFPVEEKNLHVPPFSTMFRILEKELPINEYWIVVGYSFGDRFIRDIFINASRKDTKMIILNPEANQIRQYIKSHGHFNGKIIPIDNSFPSGDSEGVADKISNTIYEFQ